MPRARSDKADDVPASRPIHGYGAVPGARHIRRKCRAGTGSLNPSAVNQLVADATGGHRLPVS